jgi:hypothetical protein
LGEEPELKVSTQAGKLDSESCYSHQIPPVIFEVIINVALTGNLSGDVYTQAVELRMKIMSKTTIMTKANLKI